MIDLLFTAWNRFEYTRAAWAALLTHTDWELVRALHVADDGSTDGTAGWLEGAARAAPVPVVWHRRFGGPVAAMNQALATIAPGTDALAKVDNDLIVCPGWLAELARLLDETGAVVVGVEPGFGDGGPQPCPHERTLRPAAHVGGNGLFHRDAFRAGPIPARGRFGWTEYQRRLGGRVGWASPDLPVFSLDRIPAEPWLSLAREHVARGWSRPWPVYEPALCGYWDWWLPGQAEAA